MKTLALKKICVVMSRIPDPASPRFPDQLDLLRQMGYFLCIVSLNGLPGPEHIAYSRLKEQCIPLALSRSQIPQAILTLLLLAIIAPIKSLRAFGVMMKMLFRFKDRKQVIKNYLQAGILVNLYIIDKEISHLHAHCERNAVRTVYLSSLLTGLNSSYWAQAGEIFAPDFPLLQPALVQGAAVFTLSEYEQAALLEKVFINVDPLPKIFRTFNGIDLEKFEFSRFPSLPEEPYRLFTAAYLSRQKGLDTVLRALRELKDGGLHFHYRIAGDGPARAALEDLVKTLRLADCVVFTGFRPHYEIPRLLAETDLFVLAPRILETGEQDSLPLGIEEAMAAGVPVVATDCGAVRELVESEETGLLARPEDPSAFAAACRRLLTDRELRSQVILKARLQMEGGYNIHKQAEAFNDYLAIHASPL
ncbi:MAG: glycosyltransferase family 4 protein [Victivallaceae bacterium]|nr:glycosyltransferase family 4 protein [Victivallaceae bacterium]